MTEPLIDYDAVDRLRAEPLDWRYKGLPPDVTSVEDLIGRRVPVDGFPAPVAVLDGPAMTGNLDRYAAFCAERGLSFAPHVKTTMAPALAAEQARRGAWAFTVANVAQARVLRAFGARRLLIAHGVVDAASVSWVAAQQEHAEIYCWVDSPAAVAALEGRAAPDRPVPVFVELGLPGGRTGARGVSAAAEVARAVEKASGLRLAGVAGYEGSYGHDRSAGSVSSVRRHLDELVRLADAVDAEAVTAGGSAYPDLVAEAFAGLGGGRRPVLRSGAYVAHDDVHYAGLSPFPLRPALRVWATVVSTPEPGLAFLNLGKRDVSYDLDLPVPLAVLRAGERRPAERLTVTGLNDQHAYLSDPDGEVEVGDWVVCGISHPCTMFERWRALPVVDADDRVTDLVRTFF
ncbi:alanine racemase [Planosporangium mesophilum]|uniref:Amino acid deaminase n=1 Tax=Planosporangium mesophilum TaxID=689768 RepID=A0A8J3TRK8_9ACTN|nr:alanine racemase [Planosporangium mesophilum]NJC82452.1 amino acid deaminase [Planosporangium mesophilum]GII26040.1 amino acid deaminase [Planosporangium mesophilum]